MKTINSLFKRLKRNHAVEHNINHDCYLWLKKEEEKRHEENLAAAYLGVMVVGYIIYLWVKANV